METERKENVIILYEHPKDCCGCGTCAAACPKHAITMAADSAGFLFPQIDERLCVLCGMCKNVCAFQQENTPYTPLAAYALARKDTDARKLSASGGAFSVFAEQTLSNGGVVFGAAWNLEDMVLVLRHRMATSLDDLAPLRGSKYVQSDLGDTFIQARRQLESGKKVLYSGTPCQIAALKSFLKKDYDNLLTVDLVCHGVPNVQMFQGYLKVLEKQFHGKIIDFNFRFKNEDWGEDALICFLNSRGERQSKIIPRYESSYYDYFFQNLILRDSCHNCSYAGKQHPADLTVADFWGLTDEHPEIAEIWKELDINSGISALIVNTKKGEKFFSECVDEFNWISSTFEKVSKQNPQLVHPSKPGPNREKLLELYRKKGFRAVDDGYWRNKRNVAYCNWAKYHLHHDIPEPIRKFAKKILRRNN